MASVLSAYRDAKVETRSAHADHPKLGAPAAFRLTKERYSGLPARRAGVAGQRIAQHWKNEGGEGVAVGAESEPG